MAGRTIVCFQDDTPGPRGTDCPNALHDHPLPSGYLSAADVARRRLNQGWLNHRCPDCGEYGWKPRQFVIWTRYVNPNGKVVRQVFGPYSTRSRAQSALKRMLKANEGYGNDLDQVEAVVTVLVGDQP